MPLNARDLETYRRDEHLGHKLLTPEERARLLKVCSSEEPLSLPPYLPSPRRSRASSRARDAEVKGRLGVRRFLRRQFHLFVYTLIHAFFSLYMRLRHAYHAVANRMYSIVYHHHRTPELIRRDVQGLRRLPRHLSVILTLEDERRSGAGLEKLINEAADVAAWCASAGIPQLSIYEKTGILKGYLQETHHAINKQLLAYFGPVNCPSLTVGAPHTPSIETPSLSRGLEHDQTPSDSDTEVSVDAGIRPTGSSKHLSVLLISAEDGRDSVVDLTKTLAEMAQRKKLRPADITLELVDAELSESIMGEPDLLVLFGPHIELEGYPPWQIRLTEIFHVQDNHGVGYHVFIRALQRYAQAQMRRGR